MYVNIPTKKKALHILEAVYRTMKIMFHNISQFIQFIWLIRYCYSLNHFQNATYQITTTQFLSKNYEEPSTSKKKKKIQQRERTFLVCLNSTLCHSCHDMPFKSGMNMLYDDFKISDDIHQ